MAITHVVEAKTSEQACDFKHIRVGEAFVLLEHTYTGQLKIVGMAAGIWLKAMVGKSSLLDGSPTCYRFLPEDRVHRVTLSVIPVSAASEGVGR